MGKKKEKKIKYVMYLDETGVAGADTGPFSIAACIMDKKYISEVTDKLNQFKKECFDTEDIIIHLKDITEREKDFVIQKITNPQIDAFWKDMPGFLKGIECKIISITIDKQRLKKYFRTPKDAYAVAFGHLLKVVYDFLNDENIEGIDIVAESREPNLNFIVQRAFFDIYNSGTVHLDVCEQRSKIKSFEFEDKDKNIAGLQIADMICNPLSRTRLGKDEIRPKFSGPYEDKRIFNAISDKLYCPYDPRDIKNWSFKKVPVIKNPGMWKDEI